MEQKNLNSENFLTFTSFLRFLAEDHNHDQSLLDRWSEEHDGIGDVEQALEYNNLLLQAIGSAMIFRAFSGIKPHISDDEWGLLTSIIEPL